jgi:hypothetical protein
MELIHLPLLRVQRDLYAQPRSIARFREYLALLTGGADELRVPLVAMNPMAKEHVARALDAWLALDADGAAAATLSVAAGRVSGAPGRLQIAMVVADDVSGGWTNRYTTDFSNRFESKPLLDRDFAVALLWASEVPQVRTVEREVQLAVARAVWQRTRGVGRTLRQLLEQEHFALRFAGEEPKPLPAEHLEAADAPTLFAVLYGDTAAASLGYPPLRFGPVL